MSDVQAKPTWSSTGPWRHFYDTVECMLVQSLTQAGPEGTSAEELEVHDDYCVSLIVRRFWSYVGFRTLFGRYRTLSLRYCVVSIGIAQEVHEA